MISILKNLLDFNFIYLWIFSHLEENLYLDLSEFIQIWDCPISIIGIIAIQTWFFQFFYHGILSVSEKSHLS